MSAKCNPQSSAVRHTDQISGHGGTLLRPLATIRRRQCSAGARHRNEPAIRESNAIKISIEPSFPQRPLLSIRRHQTRSKWSHRDIRSVPKRHADQRIPLRSWVQPPPVIQRMRRQTRRAQQQRQDERSPRETHGATLTKIPAKVNLLTGAAVKPDDIERRSLDFADQRMLERITAGSSAAQEPVRSSRPQVP